MTAAGVRVIVLVMMAAAHRGMVSKRAGQKRFRRLIRGPGNPAEQPDPGLRQRILGAASDSAADQSVNLPCRKKSHQRTVAGAHCVDNFGVLNFSLGGRIDFELPGVPEMLKYVPILICNCNFHLRILL